MKSSTQIRGFVSAFSLLRITAAIFYSFIAAAAAIGGPFERPWGREQTEVTLVTGIVWDGATLSEPNLKAIEALREQFPRQPLTHFINPAYFVRENSSQQASTIIARAMRPGDGVALHLAPWKSLTEKAGVVFRGAPTFWGRSIAEDECEMDCGREVPLNIYPAEEIRRIAGVSASALEMYGFGKPKAVFVNGWMASPLVMEQLAAVGLTLDFSSVVPDSVKTKIGRYPIYNWIKELWGSQLGGAPVIVNTPNGAITTHPSSGGVVDYNTAEEISAAFTKLVEVNPSRTGRYFYLGLHQESAAQFATRFAVALDSIKTQALSRKVDLTTWIPPGGNIPSATVDLSH